MVCVPKMLDVLREYVLRVAPVGRRTRPPRRCAGGDAGGSTATCTGCFGWKFWSFVVGAAPLDRPLEEFWSRLGYMVIQGYGLTETAPIVTLNHPVLARRRARWASRFTAWRSSIAQDGEILVRGENVTRGLLRRGRHGGRVRGRLAAHGRHRRHRRPGPGLHPRPEEGDDRHARGTERLPGGRRARAGCGPRGERCRPSSGRPQRRGARARRAGAGPGADPDAVVPRRQRCSSPITSASAVSRAGPARNLPRTEGTRKLKRREIKAWLEAGAATVPPRSAAGARAIARGHRGALRAPACRHLRRRRPRIEALGFSSLERVELLMALEDRFEVTLDEAGVRRRAHHRRPRGARGRPRDRGCAPDRRSAPTPTRRPPRRAGAGCPRARPSSFEFPRWSRGVVARAVRRASLSTWILPLLRVFVWLRVEGAQHLARARGPGRVRREPPEPSRRTDDPGGAAAALALSPGDRHGQGVLQGPLLPDQFGRRAWLTNSAQLLPGGPVLQRVPTAAARGRHAPDAALRRRTRRRGLLAADLPGGQAHRPRRNRAVPVRRRHDRRATGAARRPGAPRGRRPGPPPVLAHGPSGPRVVRFGRRCCSRATTTPRSRPGAGGGREALTWPLARRARNGCNFAAQGTHPR